MGLTSREKEDIAVHQAMRTAKIPAGVFQKNSAIGQCMDKAKKMIKTDLEDDDKDLPMPVFSGVADPYTVKEAMAEWRAKKAAKLKKK